MPLNIVCVLRSGPEYRVDHVLALAEGVRRNLSLPHRFMCLTDVMRDFRRIDVDVVDAMPLPNSKWPGWWSKICLFAPGLFRGPVVYLDLDSIVVGPLDDIVLGHRFTVLRNFHAEDFKEPHRISSALMAWDMDLSSIYKRFCLSAERVIREYKTTAHWGDQAFIQENTPVNPDRWQDKYPGRVVSFKEHVKKQGGIPLGASVVGFHGPPRPWQMQPHERAWFDNVKEAA